MSVHLLAALGRSWRLALAVSGLLIVLMPTDTAAARRPQPLALNIDVTDSERLPHAVWCRAEQMIADIYRRLAVNIVWIDAYSCDGEDTSDRGFAPRAKPDEAGRAIYVVSDQLWRLAGTYDVDVATLFAHVVAHEIGDLLLPYGAHSVAGIMRAQWDLQQLRAAERRALSFSPDEASVIRKTLTAWIRPAGFDAPSATRAIVETLDLSRRTR
jgi:hypothetical protein